MWATNNIVYIQHRARFALQLISHCARANRAAMTLPCDARRLQVVTTILHNAPMFDIPDVGATCFGSFWKAKLCSKGQRVWLNIHLRWSEGIRRPPGPGCPARFRWRTLYCSKTCAESKRAAANAESWIQTRWRNESEML